MKKLHRDEVRIIRIPFSAVEKLLFENLMENGDEYFNIKRNDDTLFYMIFDEETGDLVYAVSNRKSKVDFDVLKKATGITADSLFTPNTKFYVAKKVSKLNKEYNSKETDDFYKENKN